MKNYILALVAVFLLLISSLMAQTRVYRQTKSVSVHQTGKVIESRDNGNLFEITLEIDELNDKVYKTMVKRLDKDSSYNINKSYTMKKDKTTIGSQMGDGGKTIIAVADNGDEILEIGDEFLFSSKGSTFSQMITGIYRRVR